MSLSVCGALLMLTLQDFQSLTYNLILNNYLVTKNEIRITKYNTLLPAPRSYFNFLGPVLKCGFYTLKQTNPMFPTG